MPACVPFLPGEDRLLRGDRAVLMRGKGLYPLVGGIQLCKGSECLQESGSGSRSSSKELLGTQDTRHPQRTMKPGWWWTLEIIETDKTVQKNGRCYGIEI